MSGSASEQIHQHANRQHAGFPESDPAFEADRAARASLVDRFLSTMATAGNPGLQRKLGATVRQLTGQEPDEYWSAVLVGDDGQEREVIVFSDGRHGWSDELVYSDRPRSAADEIPPDQLRTALNAILDASGLSWPEPDQGGGSGR